MIGLEDINAIPVSLPRKACQGELQLEGLKMFLSTVLSSSALLTAIGFLSRNWFIARITKSIQHEYDKDMETYKDNLRKHTESELVTLQGKVDVEVEKAKLKLSFYSESQFKKYNDLWLILCELKKAMFKLWTTSATEDEFLNFREKLFSASDVIEQNSLLIEPEHYDQFQRILGEFDRYQFGKQALRELQQENNNRIPANLEEIQKWTISTSTTKNELLKYISEMRDCLRNQIHGQNVKNTL